MRAADQFHVGIVVDDLDATLGSLTNLFGYTWCERFDASIEVRLPEGNRQIPLAFAYSRNEPRLEIVRAIPGTLWVPAEGSGIHHLGYWSDDVPGDSAALTAGGYREEAAGITPDGVPYWAYHRHPDGPRIELVSRDLEPMLQQLWETGKF